MRAPLGAPWRPLARLVVLAAVLQPCATTRRECGLLVVEAGAPRTGSTQQERLINVALKELGLSDKVSDCGYYDWANHAKLDAAEAKKSAAELEARPQGWVPAPATAAPRSRPPAQEKMATWTRDTVVLYKSHEYRPEMLTLCDRAVVLLTHASCVERTVRSVVAAHFIEADRDAVLGHLRLAFDDLFAWKQHAALDQGLDDLVTDPVRSLASVYHILASKMGIPYTKAPDFSRYADELQEEGNVVIPHHSLDDQTKRKLRAYVLEAKNEMGGEQRLTGVKWLCDLDKDNKR